MSAYTLYQQSKYDESIIAADRSSSSIPAIAMSATPIT